MTELLIPKPTLWVDSKKEMLEQSNCIYWISGNVGSVKSGIIEMSHLPGEMISLSIPDHNNPARIEVVHHNDFTITDIDEMIFDISILGDNHPHFNKKIPVNPSDFKKAFADADKAGHYAFLILQLNDSYFEFKCISECGNYYFFSELFPGLTSLDEQPQYTGAFGIDLFEENDSDVDEDSDLIRCAGVHVEISELEKVMLSLDDNNSILLTDFGDDGREIPLDTKVSLYFLQEVSHCIP